MYSNVVLGVDHHEFEDILEDFKDRKNITLDTDLTADDWKQMVKVSYKAKVEEATGKPFPQDPREQLWGAIGAVFGSWNNPRAETYRRLQNISGELGHGGERPVDGVRQPGRDLGDGRRLHPQSDNRRATSSTASS